MWTDVLPTNPVSCFSSVVRKRGLRELEDSSPSKGRGQSGWDSWAVRLLTSCKEAAWEQR